MQSCCFATNSYPVATCLFSQRSIERKIDAGKGAWEEGSFPLFFLPSLDAPRSHLPQCEYREATGYDSGFADLNLFLS